MKNSNYIVIQQPTNLDKLEALKSFLKALKIKVEFSTLSKKILMLLIYLN
jgi:hypothetical protein